MRSPILTLLLALGFLSSACTIAQAKETPEEIEAREIALDHLLSERDSIAAFNKTVEAAKNAGVGKQAILEARFLFHVDLRDDAAIAAMLPEFKQQREKFQQTESVIFATKEDWLAVVEYVSAIAALQKGDRDGFKEHIKEAFWLGPRQAAAFAPHIERLRLDEAMKAITVDFKAPMTSLDKLKPVTLEPYMKGKKALLLHFWSPHSTECEASMDDFVKTAKILNQHKVAVVSISPHNDPKDQSRAIAAAKPYMKKVDGLWIVEKEGASLGEQLRIQNLPAVVLLSPDGTVLFNGEPADQHFWDTLKKINPKIERPLTDGDYDQ